MHICKCIDAESATVEISYKLPMGGKAARLCCEADAERLAALFWEVLPNLTYNHLAKIMSEKARIT